MKFRHLLQSLTEASLSPKEIQKYNGKRLEVFLKKIKDGLEFETSAGNVKIKNNKENIDLINAVYDGTAPKGVEFETTDGKMIKLSQITKTAEFGGAGNTTAKEDAELASLKAQIEERIVEDAMPYIIINVNGVKHKVTGAESTPGTPKSDFHLLDENGEECVWISHKDGKGARDFQQWGGVSKKEYPKMPKDVEMFVKAIQEEFGSEMPRKTTVAISIKDKKLQHTAVYGIDYGSKLGRQNVSVLLQGPVGLKKKGKFYELTAYNVHYNGDLQKGDFEPVLMAIYKGDRSNFGIKGARFGISPRGSRKVTKWLD